MNFLPNIFSPDPPEDYRQTHGILRYLEVFWDNMGKLFTLNLLCFLGFLPLAMGVSLGLTLENFWLTLVFGILGGGLAFPIFHSACLTAICCFTGSSFAWFPFWKKQLAACWWQKFVRGLVLGLFLALLLETGSLFHQTLLQGTAPWPLVFLGLTADGFALALAFVILNLPGTGALGDTLRIAFSKRTRILVSAAALLFWAALGLSLFPVCVPFAVVIGYWPILLFLAQLTLPLADTGSLTDAAMKAETTKNRKIPLPLLLGILIPVTIGLSVFRYNHAWQEPDLQIAIVHKTALPDAVIQSLEDALEAILPDQNDDGAVTVTIHDYPLTFSGNAPDPNVQTAGMTQLAADLSAKDSMFFLVEEKDAFLHAYGDLMAAETPGIWGQQAFFLSLDIGTYLSLEENNCILSGQELLAPLWVILRADCPSDIAATLSLN